MVILLYWFCSILQKANFNYVGTNILNSEQNILITDVIFKKQKY